MDEQIIRLIETQTTLAKTFKTVIDKDNWIRSPYITSRKKGGASYDSLSSDLDNKKRVEKLKLWLSEIDTVRTTYKQELKMVTTLLGKRNKILKETSGFHDVRRIREFYFIITEIVEEHLQRTSEYQNMISDKGMSQLNEIKDIEIGFLTDISTGEFDVILESKVIGLDDEFSSDKIDLHKSTPVAPLYMHEMFFREYPEILKSLKDKGFNPKPTNDNKMHILRTNAPVWNPNRHFFDQEIKTLQYYYNELQKMTYGVFIDGVFIEPWMYFHINFFKASIPDSTINPHTGVATNKDVIKEPPLRDNEWLFMQDAYQEAGRQGKAIFIAATRRFAKTTMIASHLHWKLLTGGMNLMLSSSTSSDLKHIANDFILSHENMNKAFIAYIVTRDWEQEVVFGVRTKINQTYRQAILQITNLEKGTGKKSEKLAGFTPDCFVMDEAMKSPFKASLDAVWPALGSDGGLRCTPIISGCLTAGNKVYTKEGKRVNIEDLRIEEGIIGYDKDSNSAAGEDITNLNPPTLKECVLITTKTGDTVECSYDHPFLVKRRNVTESFIKSDGTIVRRRKLVWVEAKDLLNGDMLVKPKEIPLTGKLEMKDAYFIGLLIGDGNYSGDRGARLSNEDEDVWRYVDSIGKDYTITKEYTTALGRQYKEATFKGGMKFLKDLGIYGQKGDSKDLPNDIDLYQEDDIRNLLRGLFDADGWVSLDEVRGNKGVHISSISEIMIDNVKSLLGRMGIKSFKVTMKPDGRIRKIMSKRDYYQLNISSKKSVIEYSNKIGFGIKRKSDTLYKAVKMLEEKADKEDKTYEDMIFDSVTSVAHVGEKPVYNLTTSSTHTYLANGFVTHNTGGNDDLAQDAFSLLKSPGEKIMSMNWNFLNDHVPKHLRTWREQPFGLFAPGQMAQKPGMRKIKTTLDKFLGKEGKILSKIEILVTDWEHNKKEIERIRHSYRHKRIEQIKETVYHPFSPEEIFMSTKVTPFPVAEAKMHLEWLRSQELTGRKVRIMPQGKYYSFFDDPKGEIATFPNTATNIDSPIVMFEEPPENPPDNLYICSLDDYKQESSSSDSVGSFMMYKRQSGMDPMGGRLVATLATRPLPHSKFHRTMHMMQKRWNALNLMENEDTGYVDYLNTKKETDRWLVPTFNLKGNLEITANKNRTYGVSPRSNKSQIINQVVTYTNEEDVEIPDGMGGVIRGLGVIRINDEILLEEIINYNEELNVDRITSFGIVLIYDQFLQANYINTPTNISKGEIKKKLEIPKVRYSFSKGTIGGKTITRKSGLFKRN